MTKMSQLLAVQLEQFYFGGNWTASTFKDQLEDIDWEIASAQSAANHTIVELVYHIHYYARIKIGVLSGGPLVGKDVESFDHPSIKNNEEWVSFLGLIWEEAKHLVELIKQLPEDRWTQTFVDEKYGTYYRNIQGLIEHGYYHLGQIVMLKKMLSKSQS